MENDANLIRNIKRLGAEGNADAIGFLIANAFLHLRDKGILRGSNEGYEATIHEINSHSTDKSIAEYRAYLDTLSCEDVKMIVRYAIGGKIFPEYSSCATLGDTLSRLILKLLRLEGGDSLLDIGSGYGGFLINAYEYARENGILLQCVFGTELNSTAVNLSNMALDILCEGQGTPHIGQGDVLTDCLPTTSVRFAFPPLGLRLKGIDKGVETRFPGVKLTGRNSAEWAFIDKMLQGKPSRAVAITTMKALYNDADKPYRDSLIRDGLLEGIIELPAGSIDQLGVHICVLVFSKGNKKVKLVDATGLFKGKDRLPRPEDLPSEEIFRLYGENKNFKSIDEAIESNNLVPSSVLMKVETPKNGIRLGEVAEVFSGAQYTVRNFEGMLSEENTGYKILASGDIEDGTVNWESLPNVALKDGKFDKYAVKQGDLIITSKSSKVKTVAVEIEPKEKVIVTGGMIIVRPDEEKLNATFLKIYLDSPRGQMTLKSIQKGLAIVTLNPRDLSGILIPKVDLEKQKMKAVIYNEKLFAVIAYKKEIAKLENSLTDFYVKEFGDE